MRASQADFWPAEAARCRGVCFFYKKGMLFSTQCPKVSGLSTVTLSSSAVNLKVMSSEKDPAEIRLIRRSSLKREARRFLEKSAPHPPSCESPLKLRRHLVQ
jgi:hypothetical protein